MAISLIKILFIDQYRSFLISLCMNPTRCWALDPLCATTKSVLELLPQHTEDSFAKKFYI